MTVTVTAADSGFTCTDSAGESMSPGDRQKLRDYNRRVVRWAEQFDRKYHDVALVLGWAGDKDGMTARRRSVASLVKLSREHHRAGRIDRPLSDRTTWRHLAALKAAGCVAVTTAKRGFADKHRGMKFANSYLPDFTVVIREGRPAEWRGFGEPLEADVTVPSGADVTRHSPPCGTTQAVTGTKVGTKVGTVSSSYLAPVSDHHEPGQERDADVTSPQRPASDNQGYEKVAAAVPAQWPADSPLRGYVRTAWKIYAKDGFTPKDIVLAVDDDSIAWWKIASSQAFIHNAKFRARLEDIRRNRVRAQISDTFRAVDARADAGRPLDRAGLLKLWRRFRAEYAAIGEPVPDTVRCGIKYRLDLLEP